MVFISGMKIVAAFLIIHCVVSLLPQYQDKHLKVARRIYYLIWIGTYITQVFELWGYHDSVMKNIIMYIIIAVIFFIIAIIIDFFAVRAKNIWDIIDKISGIKRK
ncbi:hypothetical protein [Tepidibacter thalassicus]|uniref:Uncharacterized protein n=1 Tax=Tepidibacter thalassicus DSM 15285 TaxID=1123350 RepID=A0A1M5QHB7_9FIRM|nr:hypothetical protein [Tepidibacter thalassicus]SHH13535.1 hypothetical protein SAMN02744040_00953 [Tepidibacter thalassicus DSM 15285]